MPQSQATATLPRVPSVRGTNFHPVPLQRVQFSSAMLWLPGFIPASLLQRIRASTPWGKPGFGKTVEGFAATEMATPACPALRTYLTGVFLAFSHRHSNDPWVRPHDGIPLRTFVH